MNQLAPTPAAEHRRTFTVDEFLTICASGVFAEAEHVELWDGEIIMSPSEGADHFNVKARILALMAANTPAGLMVGPTGPLKLGDRTLLEPDLFWFAPRGKSDIPIPEQMQLVIEVAFTSLKRDRTGKAQRYARAGIADYWVVDMDSLTTWVHRKPSADGFGDVREYAPTEGVSPLAAPTLSWRMSELFPS